MVRTIGELALEPALEHLDPVLVVELAPQDAAIRPIADADVHAVVVPIERVGGLEVRRPGIAVEGLVERQRERTAGEQRRVGHGPDVEVALRAYFRAAAEVLAIAELDAAAELVGAWRGFLHIHGCVEIRAAHILGLDHVGREEQAAGQLHQARGLRPFAAGLVEHVAGRAGLQADRWMEHEAGLERVAIALHTADPVGFEGIVGDDLGDGRFLGGGDARVEGEGECGSGRAGERELVELHDDAISSA
jgi:hypothetical protein